MRSENEGPFVTAVIKARNEAAQIADCIATLHGFADEVVVVNDASDDMTAEIARANGAIVINAASRNGMIDELDRIGFEAATGAWILRMDADERLIPSLAARLLEAAKSGQWNGVRFARKNIMFGDWARFGGWFRNDQLRFFRASAWDRDWQFSELHSQVPVLGRVLDLPATEEFATVHLDYSDVPQFVRRSLLGYARVDAECAYAKGRRFSGVRLVWRPVRRFVVRYFIRWGWRDGARGLILAGLLAAYDFCVEANLWDIERAQRATQP